MRGSGRLWQTVWSAAALIAIPVSAQGQSVNEFRLPSASPTTAPRVQGPVDPDNPVIAAPRPSPRPSTAAASPPPTASVAPAASASPTGPEAPPSNSPSAPATTRRTPPPPQSSQTRQAPGTAASLPANPAPTAAAPAPVLSDAPIFSAQPAAPAGTAPPTAPTATSAGLPGWLIPLGAALAALIAALAGFWWWSRRREAAPPVIEFERPVVRTRSAPENQHAAPRPEETTGANPVIPAAAQPAETALPAEENDGLALAFEVKRLSASLMATTLSYSLTLTNRSGSPLSALAIEGDMIAAHSQVPTEQQLAQPGQKLELRHALVELGAGESAVFSGDFRLPLELITPIRAGTAAYFVPLARFRVEAGPTVLTRTFVIGETPEAPGAALKPFRLDLGPRTYSRIGQRGVG